MKVKGGDKRKTKERRCNLGGVGESVKIVVNGCNYSFYSSNSIYQYNYWYKKPTRNEKE